MAADSPPRPVVVLLCGGAEEARLARARALRAEGAVVAITGDDQAWLHAHAAAADLVLTLRAGEPRSAPIALAAVVDALGGLDRVVHLAPALPPPEARPAAQDAALAAALALPRVLDAEALVALAASGGALVHELPADDGTPATAAVRGAIEAWASAVGASAVAAPARASPARPAPAAPAAVSSPAAPAAAAAPAAPAAAATAAPPRQRDRLRALVSSLRARLGGVS